MWEVLQSYKLKTIQFGFQLINISKHQTWGLQRAEDADKNLKQSKKTDEHESMLRQIYNE